VTLSLLLAHPEAFFRECLAGAFAAGDGAEVVGATGDESEAAVLTADLVPDVVVTAAVLDRGSGLSLARRIGSTTPVVVLTPGDEADVLMAAAQAGASGCLAHASGLERVVALVRSARPGRFVVDPDRLHHALRKIAGAGASRARASSRLEGLSAREKEVLTLVAQGLDNDAIASHLYLSANTVRTHVGNILKKLGVHSRAEAARVAIRAGATTPDVHMVRLSGPDLTPR
jgi:DNA-binding NarL/FixJ family response regulator